MSDIEELLHCSFCGGEAETDEEHTDNGGVEVYYREYHTYMVRCKKCGASKWVYAHNAEQIKPPLIGFGVRNVLRSKSRA